MLDRRRLLAGFARLSGLSLAGCGSRHAPQPSFAYAPPGGGSWTPKPGGLDAVIERIEKGNIPSAPKGEKK